MAWICLILQIPYGLGRHGLVVPIPDRIKFEQITFWKTVFSDGVAMGLLRLSMAISLLRLKSDLNWYRWSLFAVMGTLLLPLLLLRWILTALNRLRCGVLDPGHCLVVRLLHAVLGVVGVPMAEPI
jgi:hypothetical protein